MSYIEPFQGNIDLIEDLGLDYVLMPCGAEGCQCQYAYPYVVMALIGKAKFLIDKDHTARQAIESAKQFRKMHDKEWAWEIKMSQGFKHILEVEEANFDCKVKHNKVRKEDFYHPPGHRH